MLLEPDFTVRFEPPSRRCAPWPGLTGLAPLNSLCLRLPPPPQACAPRHRPLAPPRSRAATAAARGASLFLFPPGLLLFPDSFTVYAIEAL